MAASLKSIDSQIGSFAAEIVKGGDITGSDSIATGFKTSGFGSILSKIPLIGNFLSSLFGTRTDLLASGLYGAPQTVGQINASGYTGQSYNDVQKTSKFFGIVTGRSNSTQYGGLDASVNDQFTLILQSFTKAIAAAATPLGDATDAVQAKLDGFVVNIGKIDLKGLSGDDIEKKLQNVFGSLGDDMASYVFPEITKFQKVGEGALETLVRVASTVEAVTTALDELGSSSANLGIEREDGPRQPVRQRQRHDGRDRRLFYPLLLVGRAGGGEDGADGQGVRQPRPVDAGDARRLPPAGRGAGPDHDGGAVDLCHPAPARAGVRRPERDDGRRQERGRHRVGGVPTSRSSYGRRWATPPRSARPSSPSSIRPTGR